MKSSPYIAGELWVFTKQLPLPANLDAALSRVKDAGYDAVEWFPADLAANASMLRRHGLQAKTAHALTPALADTATLVAQLKAFDCPDVAVSGLMNWNERSDFQRAGEMIRVATPILARDGIRLSYHNHDFEFARLPDGRSGFDLLLEAAPDLKLCLDVGWVWYAGLDPVAFLNQHAKRVCTLHLRDFDGRASCPLGKGQMPVGELVDVARKLPNVQCLVIEQDPTTPDPAGDMAASLRWLHRQLGS